MLSTPPIIYDVAMTPIQPDIFFFKFRALGFAELWRHFRKNRHHIIISCVLRCNHHLLHKTINAKMILSGKQQQQQTTNNKQQTIKGTRHDGW